MAIINQYKAIYPIINSRFENEDVYINATSMEKAVNMITTEKGSEPIMISKIHDNVLTEPTEETTVAFEIKSYYIDEESGEEIEVPNCIAYPTSVPSCTRGSTLYMQTPNYSFIEIVEEEEITVNYTFKKWIYNETEYTSNPQIFTIPLDEEVSSVSVKAIYTRSVE